MTGLFCPVMSNLRVSGLATHSHTICCRKWLLKWHKKRSLYNLGYKDFCIFLSGGTEGTRTLGLRRDRPAL